MKTVASFLLFFVAAPSLVDSTFFRRKGYFQSCSCNSLKQAFEDLQGDVQDCDFTSTDPILQNAPPLDDVTGPLQTQVTSLQNQTDDQQAALDMLTSQCDCQSYEERLDSLNASLVALQAMVQALVMDSMSDLNGTLRLVNNVNSEMNQGRLEIFIKGEWGTICQDFWSKNDAIVACNQLGLPSGDPTALKGTTDPISPFGPGTGPIWLDNLLCGGPEASLLDCNNSGDGIGRTNCDHTQDVGVICKN